ncbi:Membrane protein involved in the export of O-antigen and teichoic acid [Marinobacter segnicrescens]|uniref:Membrane protein involved in the export of O-antigen and teichoic acid n=1 Tax=Marinobacter segnicrescens TaxID=430453 RepID=A0A1I0E846_9GAMM|nr:oligosaccharide flippase family protein [Marinobacter segnicrescens]SET41045.1 Membrane protein involved in the export of O-antigen and teichoic acid [Marinobacter segnicrescens]
MKLLNPVQRMFEGSAGQVFRGMVTMALGSGAAKAIALLVVPLLTRIYTPDDYGVLSVFTSLIFLLVPFLTFRYVMAIPLPRRDGLAMNLLVLSGLLMLVTTSLVTLALGLFGETLLAPFSMEALVPWWWLLGLGMLGTAGYETATLWASRRRTYKPIARSQITQSIGGALAKLGLGLAGFTSVGLLVGQVVTQSAGTGSLFRRFRTDLRQNWRYVSWSRLKKTASLYRRFPTWRMPSQVLLAFSIQAPVLLTALIYDAGTTGQLGLAIMAISLPMALIGDNMSKAYYAEMSAIGKKHPRKIRRITWSVIRTLTVLSIAPVAVLALFGEPLFTLVFGEQWGAAGQYAAILSLFLLSQFATSPVVRVFSVMGRERVFLFINIQRALFILLAFAPGWLLGWPIEATLWAYSILLSVHRVLTVVFVFRALNSEIRNQDTLTAST